MTLALIVLQLDYDADHPDQLVEALTKVDPPSIPGFNGKVNVVPEPFASQLVDWLEEE